MGRINIETNIGATIVCLPLKGNIVYEYNPLRNFRKAEDEAGIPAGTIIDLDTDSLKFDLKHPVKMEALPSYDGSVNLILNDGVNLPRLINTRFSVTGKDTYQIVDREGDNDTNIYDLESFNTDTSLYKRINQIIKIKFNGVTLGGRMKVGNYVFYFKLADSDGNETDFAGESGIVTCYIGGLNNPSQIQGGNRDENSNKAVHFTISSIDSSYNYVKVYYTRSTSDIWTDETTTAFKILKDYPVFNGICLIVINGYEEALSISLNDINVQYLLVDAAYTLALVLNRLFLGNLRKPDIKYKELTLLALRFYPTLDLTKDIGYVDENYNDSSGKYEYYNPNNIYNYLGYWDKEIYRFGVVFILDDFSLSPVFNICGRTELTKDAPSDLASLDGEISINKDTYAITDKLNSKGVSRISLGESQITSNEVKPIGIKMKFSGKDLKTKLADLGVRGYFFVRLKRIPTILCLMVPIGLETNAHLPTLPVDNNELLTDSNDKGNKKFLMESFIDKDRMLDHSFIKRKRVYSESYIKLGGAAICPEYELNSPFFTLFFTASRFNIETANFTFDNGFCKNNGKHFYMLPEKPSSNYNYNVLIVAVDDDVKYMKNKTMLYSARAGEAEEAARVAFAKFINNGPDNINIFRGSYGPYLGIECVEDINPDIYNIHIPGYDESMMKQYFLIRYQDTSAFYAISDRIRTEEVGDIVCYRGDCFIGNYTHRMVRNFQDPTSPTNNDILYIDTWKENYNINDSEKLPKINRGDVNAVMMGHWFTTKVCSNLNLSLRSVDHSYASEELINNRPRNFYPLYAMDTSGEAKLPESFAYNHGYSSTTSDKYNWETPDVPAIKDIFKTRILYSEVAINDAFKNGYREFLLSHYRDYPMTYGELINLIELKGNLIAVFEHGVGLIPVNERVVSGAGAGGNVFINTSNVLPETLNVLSDMYGSQWPESIVKTPYYIYGVDTVGKKIWRTNGSAFDIISDFRVEKFLIDNITLAETEKTPIIGIRNVKTHYNAYKSDVMFTFYDNLDVLNERAWNLCWNEISLTFSTFYSWIPSYSANIDNMFFSFDRDTSKIIAMTTGLYYPIELKYRNSDYYIDVENIGNSFKVEPINYWDNSWITIEGTTLTNTLKVTITPPNNENFVSIPIKITYGNSSMDSNNNEVFTEIKTVYGVAAIWRGENLPTTAFWKHGLAGLTKTDRVKPCNWYGEQHPFEFEFVVRDDPNTHKIFNNLEIISNKAKPESFHFEVIGEVYNWAKDKKNMYIRLEATKELYQRLGASIKYDPNYKELVPELRRMIGSLFYDKSTYLPLYYERRTKLNQLYDTYTMMSYKSLVPRDYCNLSGSEITYNPDLNEFGVWTHIKNVPINSYEDRLITLQQYEYIRAHFMPTLRYAFEWQEDDDTIKYYERIFPGRLRGNSLYLEDKWNVQIPSITFMQKNENKWQTSEKYPKGIPPLIVETNRLPDIKRSSIDSETLPEGFTLDDVKLMPNTYDRGNGYGELTIGGWTSRKETKLRDKYIKVRVRYSGEDLAVISAIKTLYTISYA